MDDYLAGLTLLRFASPQDNRLLLDPVRSPLIGNTDNFYRILARMQVERRGVQIGPQLNPGFLP